MYQRPVRALFALFAFSFVACLAPSALGANKLWLVWDASTSACKDKTVDFFNCILNSSNFNALATAYPNGEALTLAGTHVMTKSCGATDWNCLESEAQFALTKYDVFLHFYGTSWVGGTNGTATVSGVPVVGSVFVNTGWVQSGASCNGQTCTGAHEAYEAAADSAAADCCNGQTLNDSCSKCPTSCAKYHGNSGNPPWGCYDIACPNGTYKMELLGPANAEFDPNACQKLTLTGGCAAVDTACSSDTDCCSGLVCKYWDYDGKAPYTTNCCKDIGESCSGNTDCCGGSNCTGGKCACVAEGQWCINADECCAGSSCDSTAHKCVASVPDAGAAGAPGVAGAGGQAGTGGDADSGWGAAAGTISSSGGSTAAPDGGPDAATESGGCGCRTVSRGRAAQGLWLLGLALSLACARRLGAARKRRSRFNPE